MFRRKLYPSMVISPGGTAKSYTPGRENQLKFHIRNPECQIANWDLGKTANGVRAIEIINNTIEGASKCFYKTRKGNAAIGGKFRRTRFFANTHRPSSLYYHLARS